MPLGRRDFFPVETSFLRANRHTGVQVGPPAILAALHFEELDGSHLARYVPPNIEGPPLETMYYG